MLGDNPGMNLDPVRSRLLALVAERKTDLATVSRAIPRNHAYLQQFVTRGTPRNLSEEVRESLGRHFGVDADEFRPATRFPRPPPRERKLLEDFRVLPESQQDIVVVVCEALARKPAATLPDDAAPKRGRG
jgi:hypothetical protein